MQFNQLLDQCESHTHAAVGPIKGSAGLHEQLEDALEHIGGDALSRIAHTDHGPLVFPPHGQPDLASSRSVFHGVGEQVDLDLLETGEVTHHDQRSRFDIHNQLLIATVDLRPNHFQCRVDCFAQIAGLHADIDLPLHDPRDIQQIIEQAGHEVRLPLDHFTGARAGVLCVAVSIEHIGRVQHGSERIAEFV